jgi:hypothetical protein
MAQARMKGLQQFTGCLAFWHAGGGHIMLHGVLIVGDLAHVTDRLPDERISIDAPGEIAQHNKKPA